jgi:hypothetical protein
MDEANRHLALVAVSVKKADELLLVLPVATDFVSYGKILAFDLFGQKAEERKQFISRRGRLRENAFHGKAQLADSGDNLDPRKQDPQRYQDHSYWPTARRQVTDKKRREQKTDHAQPLTDRLAEGAKADTEDGNAQN